MPGRSASTFIFITVYFQMPVTRIPLIFAFQLFLDAGTTSRLPSRFRFVTDAKSTHPVYLRLHFLGCGRHFIPLAPVPELGCRNQTTAFLF